jgi:hypothetical protein
MLGGLADNIGTHDIEAVGISEEGIGIEPGYLKYTLAALLGGLDHFVFTGIVITREMADIGDVHHVGQFITKPAKGPGNDVIEDIGTQVSDMGKIIDRGTATIEPHLAWLYGFECLQAAPVGIE